MKLTIEEIEKLSQAFYDKYAGKGLTPSEVMELHKGEYWNIILDAQLSALASTPDEGLLLTDEDLEPITLTEEDQDEIEGMATIGLAPDEPEAHEEYIRRCNYLQNLFIKRKVARAHLTKVQPVITALRAKLAEAEKEKQEAVKVNNASWEGKLQGKIDYAVEQERKRICRSLVNTGYFEDSAEFFDALVRDDGESLEVK